MCPVDSAVGGFATRHIDNQHVAKREPVFKFKQLTPIIYQRLVYVESHSG